MTFRFNFTVHIQLGRHMGDRLSKPVKRGLINDD